MQLTRIVAPFGSTRSRSWATIGMLRSARSRATITSGCDSSGPPPARCSSVRENSYDPARPECTRRRPTATSVANVQRRRLGVVRRSTMVELVHVPGDFERQPRPTGEPQPARSRHDIHWSNRRRLTKHDPVADLDVEAVRYREVDRLRRWHPADDEQLAASRTGHESGRIGEAQRDAARLERRRHSAEPSRYVPDIRLRANPGAPCAAECTRSCRRS